MRTGGLNKREIEATGWIQCVCVCVSQILEHRQLSECVYGVVWWVSSYRRLTRDRVTGHSYPGLL